MINILLRAYALAERSGALDIPPVQWLYIRSYFLYKRMFEDSYAWLVKTRPELFRGGHIIDVGANIGYTATVFARAVEAPFDVFAFEPDQRNFRRMTRTIHAPAIVPVQAAVGEADGNLELWHNDGHPGDHRIAVGEVRARARAGSLHSVPVRSIDSFAQTLDGPVRFIKIDVQGYEPAVLKGMEKVAQGDVVISLEYCPPLIRALGFREEEILIWLRQRGFDIELLHLDRTEPLTETSLAAAMARRPYVDLLCFKTGVR